MHTAAGIVADTAGHSNRGDKALAGTAAVAALVEDRAQVVLVEDMAQVVPAEGTGLNRNKQGETNTEVVNANREYRKSPKKERTKLNAEQKK